MSAGSPALGAVDRFFSISARGSTVGREIRAGLVTFLTTSYILLVNARLMSADGSIEVTDGVIATALASFVGCAMVGLLANIPFTIAPGLGITGYFAYSLIMNDNYTHADAVVCALAAGVVLLLFAVSGVTDVIQKCIPLSIKLSTIGGMGLLLTFIAFESIGLVAPDSHTFVTMGDLHRVEVYIAFVGLILVVTLINKDVPGSILAAIIGTTVIYWIATNSFPNDYVSFPHMKRSFGQDIDRHTLRSLGKHHLAGAFGFLFVLVTDVGGVVVGVGKSLEDALLQDVRGSTDEENKNTGVDSTEDDAEVLKDMDFDLDRGTKWVFISVAAGTIVSALMGAAPLIVHLESAAGIKAGGRTGLTSLVTASLFAVSLMLTPLLASVPIVASAPTLVVVGVLMSEIMTKLPWKYLPHAVPAFVCLVSMPFTFSISNGILLGLITHGALYVVNSLLLGDDITYILKRIGILKLQENAEDVMENDSGNEYRTPVDVIQSVLVRSGSMKNINEASPLMSGAGLSPREAQGVYHSDMGFSTTQSPSILDQFRKDVRSGRPFKRQNSLLNFTQSSPGRS